MEKGFDQWGHLSGQGTIKNKQSPNKWLMSGLGKIHNTYILFSKVKRESTCMNQSTEKMEWLESTSTE